MLANKATPNEAANEDPPKHVGSNKYQGNHVRRLVMRNGTIVLPDADGIFEPATQEEYDMLEHLAASSNSSLEKLEE